MKNALLFLAIPILLVAGSSNKAAAQTTTGITVTMNPITYQVRVFADIPKYASSMTTDEAGHLAAKRYVMENVVYIFLRDDLAGSGTTIWIQKTNSNEASYLGESYHDVTSPLEDLMPRATDLAKTVKGNALYNRPKLMGEIMSSEDLTVRKPTIMNVSWAALKTTIGTKTSAMPQAFASN